MPVTCNRSVVFSGYSSYLWKRRFNIIILTVYIVCIYFVRLTPLQLSSSNKIHPSVGLCIIEGRSFVFSGYLLRIIRIFIICFYILDKITGCRHWSIFVNFHKRTHNKNFVFFFFYITQEIIISRILSGKPFNTFSMARLKTLQFHLTITPLFTATHTLFFLSFIIFFPWSVIGVFGLFSCDPRFMAHIDSPWFVKFSKMENINFRESWFGFLFFNWDLWPETPPPPF